jgi:hypothetical protein
LEERTMTMEKRAEQDLQALCQMAGERAGSGKSIARVVETPPDSAATAWTRSTAVKILFATCASVLAFGVVAERLLIDPAVETPPATAAAQVALDEPWPEAAIDTESQGTAIRWQGRQLMVDVDAEPLDEVIDQLAAATHALVSGQQLLHDTGRVTLHWYAGDASTAWQLLLRERAVFAVRCESSACRVRIISQVNPTRTGNVTAPESTLRNKAPADEPSPDKESQPDGAC